jgi:iron only hydrogenase large subunit-like protein/RNase H-fold protein (predicted Holliday junction resolvase)
MHNRCIGCGDCLAVCSPAALTYTSSVENVQAFLDSGQQVVAIVAPSIAGEFTDISDYRKFVSMLRALGFHYVNEVSFGADLIASAYKELLGNFRGKYYITSLCPTLSAYIEYFHPELVDNLAPIVSPMVAAAKVVRKKYGEHIRVVYIGPCISAKCETTRLSCDARIDAVITFIELRQLFANHGIVEQTQEFSEFDGPIGHLGSLFPISNGLLQAVNIDESILNGEVTTVEGTENFMDSVREFKKYTELIRRHFNIFYCHGCLMGPGTSSCGEKYLRRSYAVDYANKRLKSFNQDEWNENMNLYADLDFSCQYSPNDQRIPMPPDEKISEILKVIGKSEEHSHLGCGACGYDSCRDFAVAVAKGLAKPEMCLTYNLRNQNEYIRTLKTTNEKLAKTEVALKDSEKLARREQQTSQEANEIVSSMLQKLTSGIVIVDENLKIVQANKTFIETLGEDAKMIDEVIPGLVGADLKTLLPYNFYNMFSYVLKNDEDVTNKDTRYNDSMLNVSIFTIRKNKIVGAVVRDMYVPEVRKEQILTRINEAIEENLEMVQKIGFLLGEGASKTERRLNSIIQSYAPEKKPNEK